MVYCRARSMVGSSSLYMDILPLLSFCEKGKTALGAPLLPVGCLVFW